MKKMDTKMLHISEVRVAERIRKDISTKTTNTPLSLAVRQRAYFRSIFSYMNTASAM